MADEQTAICSNCYKKLPESKITLHEAYCFRNVKPCPKCREMIDKKEQEAHDLEVHALKKCPDCKRDFEAKFYEPHVANCEMKPKLCTFCTLKIEKDKYSDHVYQCSSRTKVCPYCNKNVILRDFENHETSCLIALSEEQNQGFYQQPKTTEIPSKNPSNYPQKGGSFHDKPSSYPIQKEVKKEVPNIPSKETSNYQKYPSTSYQKDPINPQKDPINPYKDSLNYQKDYGNLPKEPENYMKDPPNYKKESTNYQKQSSYPQNDQYKNGKRDPKKKDSFTYLEKETNYQAPKDQYGYNRKESNELNKIPPQRDPINLTKEIPSGIQKNPFEIPAKEKEKDKPITSKNQPNIPGKQYENYINNYRDKNKEKEQLYSQQALKNKPSNPYPSNYNPNPNISKSTSTNPNFPTYHNPTNLNTKVLDDKEKKQNTTNTHNFYEKKNSVEYNPKKPHMQDYEKEYPNKPNLNINKNEPHKGKMEMQDYKNKLPENKSPGIGQNIPSRNVPMNQKPASTSFSSKAMNSQPNKPVPNKDESNKFVPPTEKNYEQTISDLSFAIHLQKFELYSNPNDYANPINGEQYKTYYSPTNNENNDQNKNSIPPVKQDFDPEDLYEKELQEVLYQSKFNPKK